jgi:ABC-2 type transport system permease protein
MTTIFILWLRQLKRYMRSRARIIGALAQPLLYLATFGFGFASVFAAAGRGDYFQFLTPGIVGMSIIFTSIFSGMGILWDRQFGFLKEILVAPVSRLSVMVGCVLGGTTTATIQGVIVLGISVLMGFHPVSWPLAGMAIIVMATIALLFSALGTLFGALVNDFQAFQLIMNFLVMPIFFLSGAMFPLDGLPKALTIITELDPLSYGVDGMRALLTGVSHFSLVLDFGVLAVTTVVLLLTGSVLFRRIQV